MTTELQNKVWSVLPKEFKKAVKKDYKGTTGDVKWDKAYNCALEETFGQDNLTSDVEVEEMLMVPRKKVEKNWQRAYEQEAKYSREQDSLSARELLYYNRGILSILDTLFGSKCLPDTKPILQPFSQVKETAASTMPVTESNKLSKLKDALLKLEEASKQVREELTKLNEK